MGKLPLEGFKFAVYVGLPVLAVTYFQRPDVFRRIIENRNYIQYPPEDERSPEELLEAIARRKLKAAGGATNSDAKAAAPAPSPVPWRRYIFFGPRDDPDALRKKRMKSAE